MSEAGIVVVIGGPTAVGKTAVALQIARKWSDAALVSADAMQVYRGMDVGTAKPDLATRKAFPHACMDVRDPDQDFSVADFLAAVRDVHRTHRHVLVVGGTPFWLAALVRPMAELPASDPAVRARLEALPDPHAALSQVDPAAAARLHPNDRFRVIRALEIHALSGRPQSELWAEGPVKPTVPCHVLWLERDGLRARIGLRLEQMMKAGYLEEVRGLLAAGYSAANKPMRSLGYRHLSEHLGGQFSLDEALRRTERDTWRLARKQRTWARGMGWEPTDSAGVMASVEGIFRE